MAVWYAPKPIYLHNAVAAAVGVFWVMRPGHAAALSVGYAAQCGQLAGRPTQRGGKVHHVITISNGGYGRGGGFRRVVSLYGALVALIGL